ncbi:arginine--tRNA ligase [Candidatus Bathyarchaeota archaeon]|nr:arginine--tRNA ligase [Candidatus Bathyarchaeota archaeon]
MLDPWGKFREECTEAIRIAFQRSFPEVNLEVIALERPPSTDLGELSSSICLNVSKKLGLNPREMASRVVQAIGLYKAEAGSRILFLKAAEVGGAGYINLYADKERLFDAVIKTALELDRTWGFLKTDSPVRIIVEHTSVNPIHPIEISHSRGTFLGDSLARILSNRGHKVSRHYYVDDLGRQTAIIAYGYDKLGRPKPTSKPDHFIGDIYAITSCILEIRRLKARIKEAKDKGDEDELMRLQKEVDDWIAAAEDLRSRQKELFERILTEVDRDSDPDEAIKELSRKYEEGDEKVKSLIREVTDLCLEGFKETLSRVGVEFDSWDWESELAWSSRVEEVLRCLKQSPYAKLVSGALELDIGAAVEDLGLRSLLGIPESYQLPSVTLTTSFGTSLYPARDIAYSLRKFELADRVINVIGLQVHPQLQLRVALCILGRRDLAECQTHFVHGYVRFPMYRMSSRRGRFVTLDQVLEEAVTKAMIEVMKRSPELSEEERKKISEIVGLGAVKYAMISTEPKKDLVFTWERVLDFERNSAPFIQYAHARASNILKKGEVVDRSVNIGLLTNPLEHDLLLRIAQFPELFVRASETLGPHLIADYANDLASAFNAFYDHLPVLRAEPRELRDARLALVKAFQITLRNALSLLGIEAPERM